MRPTLVRWLLLSACLTLLTTLTLADDVPGWLRDRTDRLMNLRSDDPAHTDTLLVLASELEDHGQHTRAADVMLQAGIRAFRALDGKRAEGIWTEGLALARAHDDLKSEASLINALAVGYSSAGKLDQALNMYEQSLAMKTALDDTAGISRTWGNITLLYRQAGRLAEALDAMAEATRWNELADNTTGRVAMMLSRASVFNQLGRVHECQQMAEQVLDVLDTTDVQDALGLALIYQAIARSGLGDDEAALRHIEAALTALEAEGAQRQATFALQWRAIFLQRLGRLDEARVALDEFRRALDADEIPRLRTTLHLYAGLIALAEGRNQDAVEVLQRATASFEERREGSDDAAFRESLFASSGEVYGVLSAAYLAQGDTLSAWRATERGQALGFREQLTGGGAVSELAAVQAVLAEADAVLVQASETQSLNLTWFVITPTSLTAVEAGAPDVLANQARLALSRLEAGAPLDQCDAALAPLGEALLTPLQPWLDDPPTRLSVVLPSLLTGLPLSVLPLPDGSRLGERVALSYVPSATALTLLLDRDPAAQGLLALGDPRLGGEAAEPGLLPSDPLLRLAATPLPEAGREVRRIAGRHGTVLLGEDARLSALVAEAGQAAVIHVASHAVSDPLDGRRSSLLLAADEVAQGPAVLTAADAETLSLHADLTVLSACRSGLGNAILGEGSVGLPRSLMLAGSRSVVSSLWDVEDGATRRFMEAFYGELRRGVPRDLALRLAAAKLRREGAPPRDWAAFVLNGVGHEPVPSLREEQPWFRSPPAIWLAGCLVMMPLVWAFARKQGRG